MFRISARAEIFAAFVASAMTLTAATPATVAAAAEPAAIGVAVSDGNVTINNASIPGNATVFSGNTLQAERETRVRLKGGAQLDFDTASQARLFSDHMDLQKGSARFSGLSASANGLRIDPDSNSSASVSLNGRVVQIAAIVGNVKVYNARGITVANLLPGRALNLTPQDAGASAPASMVGCVTKTGNVFTLTDETSNVKVQLRGGSLHAGRRIQVNGTTVANATAAGGASQVIAVTSVKDVGGSCAARAGAAAGGAVAGGTAAGVGVAAGAGAGMAAGTAVVAGVAAAAVAGTTAAVAASSSGTSSSTSGSNCLSPCASH